MNIAVDSIKSIEGNNKDSFLSLSNFSLPKSKSFVIVASFWDKILELILLIFSKKGLSCTTEIGTVKEEVGYYFNQSSDHNYKWILSNLENRV